MITEFITLIREALSFNFFVYALVTGISLAIVFALLGSFILIRKWANIAHSISHFALLWVTIALLWEFELYASMIFFAFIGASMITILKRATIFSNDSINEIVSQWWLACALIVLGFVSGYKSNITNFLFGDILAVSSIDMKSSLLLTAFTLCFFVACYKKLFQVSFHEELARSKGISLFWINTSYTVLLSLAIALSIKIIGVLLVTSFLIIPPNISKLVARNFTWWIYWSLVFSVSSVVIGLFSSYLFDIASGPMIVTVLLMMLFFAVLAKSLPNK